MLLLLRTLALLLLLDKNAFIKLSGRADDVIVDVVVVVVGIDVAPGLFAALRASA